MAASLIGCLISEFGLINFNLANSRNKNKQQLIDKPPLFRQSLCSGYVN